MSKYVHLNNNIVDFEMEAHPSNVFGEPYVSEFIFTENNEVTTGWKLKDGIFEAPEVVIQVPQTITPRQLRLQLLSATLLDEVEALCAVDKAMSIWFEYSLDFQRNHEMIITMGTQLGMSESDMDTFFIEASKL